jgi:hypothetical protein
MENTMKVFWSDLLDLAKFSGLTGMLFLAWGFWADTGNVGT